MKINLRSPKAIAAYILVFALIALGTLHFLSLSLAYKTPPQMIVKFRAAAEQGDYMTGGKLAWMYEEGTRGVEQDYKEAYYLFGLSYVQEDKLERILLERMAKLKKDLTPQEISKVEERIQGWIKKHPHLVRRSMPQ